MIEDISLIVWTATLLFFIVALAYSSVGLGGGSSYTAIMAVLGFSTLLIPMISLICNIFVSSIASYYFIKHGHLRFNLLIPFIITSMPLAWLGGSLQISPLVFQWILWFSLLTVVIRIYFWKTDTFKFSLSTNQQLLVSLFSGAILGFLAGVVGIGGGIFLVPLILLLGLGTIKEAAACGAIFIWLNSFVGLVSRLNYNFVELTQYTPLLFAIILGGFVGSRLGAIKLPANQMEKLLGSVVLVAWMFLSKSLLA